MTKATYKNIDIYCNYTRRPGFNYELSASIGGMEVKTYTNDSEIYDYLCEDYHDPSDPDWARRVAYNKLMDEACTRYNGALATINADPWLIENDEQAMQLIDTIDKHYNPVVELTPDDDEDFTDACQRLDLDPEANNVKRVLSYPATYTEPGMLVCMPDDWEIA